MRKNEWWMGYVFLAPAFVILGIFLVYPTLQSFFYSFTNATFLNPQNGHFVGIKNYTRMFQDPLFMRSVYNTLYFTALIVPIQSFLALLLAVLVNRKMKGRGFFRTVYFSPVVTSMVVVAVLWNIFYSGDGLFNALLEKLHLPAQPFLQSKYEALPSIVLMSIWQGVGYQMVIFLAGLQGIPAALYEASMLDGATRSQQFWKITIPQLRNTAIFVIIITTMFAFKLFTQVYIMTGGGPFHSTETIILNLYNNGIKFMRLGYGSAIAVVFFLIVFAIQLIQRILIKEDSA